ncbi:hypothetical protein AB0910_11230 [Streptomyces sp. NPDC047002]|uniref:HalD/BesD family halogenase n=1 Tax=Streptomyces sp. NPDC047002 TaxID=3155475 RepID=UPI003453F7C3
MASQAALGLAERFDTGGLGQRFHAAGEFLHLPDFLGSERLRALQGELPALRGEVHRNRIPGHKQGGSVSSYRLARQAPAFGELYHSPEMLDFVRTLAAPGLGPCPPDDPHAYALYHYTREGDFIGWHKDTSHYRGDRYTVLIGLVDESSCRLEYRLPGERTVRSTALAPGALVIFNGDAIEHRVTPAAAGDERIVLTLEYVTDGRMAPWRRLQTRMKDAFGYFGLREVLRGAGPRGAGSAE